MVEHEVPPGSFSLVRLTDVAHRAGVSLATASRSLNGSPGVSVALAARVTAAADKLGYIATRHSLAPSTAGSSIGLVIGPLADPWSATLANAVVAAAREADRVVQTVIAVDPSEVLGMVRLLRSAGVSAIVLASPAHSDPAADAASDIELESFQLAGGRVILIGRHGVAADAVWFDETAAARALAHHVLSLGHSSVGIVAGRRELAIVGDRLSGLCEVFAGAAATVTITHQELTRDGGTAGAEALLAEMPGRHRPTAIIGLSDPAAIGVLTLLRRRGISVPAEISVAGFDDVPVAADLVPSLTTVRRPGAAIAAEVIRFAMLGPGISPRHTIIEHELVVRESTGVTVGRRLD